MSIKQPNADELIFPLGADQQYSFLEELLPDVDLESNETPEQARKRLDLARENFLKLKPKAKERFGWYEDYAFMVEEKHWPHWLAVYIAWSTSARVDRYPETLEKLCQDVIGWTSARQLHKLKKRMRNDGFDIDASITLMRSRALFEHRSRVDAALIESASKPDYKNKPDRELFYTLVGDKSDQAPVIGTMNFTADDLAAAKSKREEVEKRFAEYTPPVSEETSPPDPSTSSGQAGGEEASE